MKALGESTIKISQLKVGESVTVSWIVKLESAGAGVSITVEAGGIIHGWVRESNGKGNGVSYPADSNTDEIDGVKSISP